MGGTCVKVSTENNWGICHSRSSIPDASISNGLGRYCRDLRAAMTSLLAKEFREKMELMGQVL